MGGITYRLFGRQQLAEIAFCAVSAVEQVKGYGTRLMDKVKEYVINHEGCTHLITFADNNAVGYFQKQARVGRVAAAVLCMLRCAGADVACGAALFQGDPAGAREVGGLHQGAPALPQRCLPALPLTAASHAPHRSMTAAR